MNEDIQASSVRVIDPEGEMLGVMATREAIAKAEEYGLDLIEVSPNAEPPVCKILDYGKFKYEEQKKKAQARKNQKIIEIKELRLRPRISDHDLEIKLKNADRFLADGDKVKFTLRFRGREMAHTELATEVFDKVKEHLGERVKIDAEPKLEGRQMVMVVSPVAHSK